MNFRSFGVPLLFVLASSSTWGAEVVLLQFERNKELLDPVAIELFDGDAPRHVANISKLVNKGFYNGTAIHRVLPGALIQLGDPLTRKNEKTDLGTGGPGYTLAPEIRRKHERGAVGMGRLPDAINPGRLSNGSQFYFVLRPLAELDGTQTVFGKVIEGMAVLEAIGTSATDTNDAPAQRVVIKRSKVVGSEALGAALGDWKPKGQAKGSSFWQRVGRWLHLSS
ncbi:MAG: peptidylprolyl isomerase [Verrucomicrobiota bacterium]